MKKHFDRERTQLGPYGVRYIIERRNTKPTQKADPKKPIALTGLRYTLEDLIGVGGMGEVWKARCVFSAAPGPQDDVGSRAAVKFVTGLDPDSPHRARFIKEAKLIAQLKHENIVRFEGWDYLEDKGAYFIVMEYIPGTDLDGLMDFHNLCSYDTPTHLLNARAAGITKIPDPIVGFVLVSMLNALEYAHNYVFEDGSRGVVHRDISPGNALIKFDEGVVKLGDFGIAATTTDLEDPEERSIIAGKIQYMPPEIALTTERVDTRSDLYSLGIVIYEMLTGIRPNDGFPHERNNLAELYNVIESFDKQLVPPHEVVKGIDEELSGIVCKLMARKPKDRYQSAAEAKDAVENYLYSRGRGVTKHSLRDYIQIRQGQKPEKRFANLRFLKHHRFRTIPTIFIQYQLTDYARTMLEKRQNPARA
ncbi:serine/threonine protein kinase [Candidatus Woesearchaeota archaeon]|nr:serine/threonine protein kinase [Candidatus Woesearchaeota archaeon]